MSLKVGIYLFLSLAIVWSSLCRLKYMDCKTDWQIGAAFSFVGIAAFLTGITPLIWTHFDWWGRMTIHWTQVFYLSSVLYLQIVMSPQWRKGVPKIFQGKK